jgi:beta-glucosidase
VYPGAAETSAESGAQSFQTSPPKYPSPWVDVSIAGNWSAAIQRAQAFVAQLTLLEKVNLTTGVG